MSSDAAEPNGDGLPDEFLQVESSVRRLLDEVAGYRARARLAEERATELERALRDVSSGALDPVQLRQRMGQVEEENQALRQRLLAAQDRIRKLIARFDFLREEM